MTKFAAVKFIAVPFICLLACAWVRADPQAPQSGQRIASCRDMIDQAQHAIQAMPEGVEKLAAQKELNSARTELTKGSEAQCQVHTKYALAAMKAKDTN